MPITRSAEPRCTTDLHDRTNDRLGCRSRLGRGGGSFAVVAEQELEAIQVSAHVLEGVGVVADEAAAPSRA